MNQMLKLELQKIFKRRLSQIVFTVLTLVFPLVITVVAKLSISEDNIPEGLFLQTLAYFVITITQSYFFLPIIILLICGKEFDGTHISLISFYKGRTYYLKSKLLYASLVSLYTTLLGFVAFQIAFQSSTYAGSIVVPDSFYPGFIIQLLVTSFAYSCYLFLFLFIFRSTTTAIVAYIILTAIEGILFKVLVKFFSQVAYAIPTFIIRSSFVEGGVPNANNYFTLTTPFSLLPALTLSASIILFVTFYFRKINLKTL